MIDGETIERAEKALAVAGEFGGMQEVYRMADSDATAVAAFVGNCRDTMKKRLPNLDPRIEPSLNTMLAHAYMVGVRCGRETAEDGR